MDKVIEIPTMQAETEPKTGTFSEEIEGGDTDEGPENDSDYRVEYDDDFYEQLGEIELEKSDSGDVLHDDDIKNELGEVELEESSSQATELQDVSYFSSSGDEKVIEKFSRNLKSYRLDEELDLKALDDSELNLISEFEINELQGSSRKDYFKIVGETSLIDYDDDIKVVKKEASKIKRTRHRKISQEQQKDKDSKNEQLNERKLFQEEQIRREQEQKMRQEQIHQEKEQQKQLLKEQRKQMEEEREEEHCLHSEGETKLKEQLRQEQKQKLLQEEQLECEEQKPKKNSSPQTQRSDIFKSRIKSQNEPTTPTIPSFSMKSFHLPDISLSQRGDVRDFKRMSNIFGNGDKGPVAALRTLTDNYRQLELDKRNADIKVGQLENQLEQYHQLLRYEQVKNKVNNKEDWLETIDVESSVKKSSQRKITLSEKGKTDPSVASLQKKYKAVKRQLEYMKTYARKAEDERDDAKKALFKTQQETAQMNVQFESLRASVQEPNERNVQTSNIGPLLPASSSLSSEIPTKPLLSKRTVEPSNINRSKDNINIQRDKQIIEPKENIRDSVLEKSKSIDPEQIKKIQEEIENSRVVRENLRKQRQAMDKTHRKKESLESEENDGVPTNKLREPQQFVFGHKEVPRNRHNFEENNEDSRKEKKKLTSHNEENRYTYSREQQYEKAYYNSKALNKQTANKTQFTNHNEDNQHGNYRKQHYDEYYEDELQFVNNRRSSKSSTFAEQNQYIDPREQQRYNDKREDQKRDNYFTRLPKRNSQYFDTRKDGSFSDQEDGGQFPHIFGRQRQFFDNMEDSDIHPRQSPARNGRVYSQNSNESRDNNVYTHIKDRRQYHYTYDNSERESDHVENRNSGEQPISLRQDYPIWRDVKNSKSYLRKRSYLQESAPLKQKPTRPGNIGREIPFILGTGTGKSHSVTVNLQKAFSLIKNHNPNSCTVCNKKNTNTSVKNKYKKQAEFESQHSEATRSENDEESPDIALGRVICNLTDELKHLKMHYSNLVEEYQMIDPSLNSKSKRSALTEEMKEIMDQMEMKGDQIATLYDIQQKTIKPSLSSKSWYGLKSKGNSQKPTRQIHETRAESLGLLRGTQRVQRTLNDL